MSSLHDKLIFGGKPFQRETIEARMHEGGFNSISRFELFLWDLEILLQLQKRLGDKVVLKGGAAAQFYIPVEAQRTSVDIDLLCSASEQEVTAALSDIESSLKGHSEDFRFRKHIPQRPRVKLSSLSTYFMTVPTSCTDKELTGSGMKQEVKVEFLFVDKQYPINRINSPKLFAVETSEIFNVLPLEYLFADKLTTLGPETIGIPEERCDEQFKQMYDLITIFNTNTEYLLEKADEIREHYRSAAKFECKLHDIDYDEEKLLEDMNNLISKVRGIENDEELMRIANDFQSLYIKRSQIKSKSDWAIAAIKLQLLVDRTFGRNRSINRFKDIETLITKLQFNDIRGPERGRKLVSAKEALRDICAEIPELRSDLFNKKPERVIWELLLYKDLDSIAEFLKIQLASRRG